MTPEPTALPLCVVTSISVTAALIFAIAASCAVSTVAVADTVVVPWVELLLPVALLLLLNCQPANRPMLKMPASNKIKSATVAVRKALPPRFVCTGGDGGCCTCGCGSCGGCGGIANAASGSYISHDCC